MAIIFSIKLSGIVAYAHGWVSTASMSDQVRAHCVVMQLEAGRVNNSPSSHLRHMNRARVSSFLSNHGLG